MKEKPKKPKVIFRGNRLYIDDLPAKKCSKYQLIQAIQWFDAYLEKTIADYQQGGREAQKKLSDLLNTSNTLKITCGGCGATWNSRIAVSDLLTPDPDLPWVQEHPQAVEQKGGQMLPVPESDKPILCKDCQKSFKPLEGKIIIIQGFPFIVCPQCNVPIGIAPRDRISESPAKEETTHQKMECKKNV